MRIVALLSWYDETPAQLAACVGSLRGLADHVVAVDGAYGLFPGGRDYSPPCNAEAIRCAARTAGIGATVFTPRRVWAGGEVQKRAFMFALAEKQTGPDDWYFVVDGDEQVTDNRDARRVLAGTDLDAGAVKLWEHPDGATGDFIPGVSSRAPTRKFFRAIRGLTVRDNHYSYVTPDGRFLWGPGWRSLVFAEETDVMVQHRKRDRPRARARAAVDYYTRRDMAGVEKP